MKELEKKPPGSRLGSRRAATTYNLLRLKEELRAPIISYVRTDFRDEDVLMDCGNMRKLNNSLEYPIISATFEDHPLIFMVTGSGSSNILTALYEGLGRGLRTIVRIGACGGLGEPKIGRVVVAESALCLDRVSRTLLHRTRAAADKRLTENIINALKRDGLEFTRGTVASADAMYFFEDEVGRAKDAGACAWDLETATVLAFGRRFGVSTASVLLAVSDEDGRSIASYPPLRRRDYVRCALRALSADNQLWP